VTTQLLDSTSTFAGLLAFNTAGSPLRRQRPRVAVVHDWLTSYSGSERVVEQILRIFPDADIFSLVDYLPPNEREFLRGKPVVTSFLQNLPFGKKIFRKLLWLLPSAIESLDVSGYDVVISSSHAVAKGVITGPEQLHICYCHSPVRYAWDFQHEYLRQAGLTTGLKSLYARAILHYLRMWDVRTSNGVDHFIANSRFIANRIWKVYRRDSAVIHPPVDVEKFHLAAVKGNFYITASRLVPYKRVDLIVDAFSQMPSLQLTVIGDGPNLSAWKKDAAPNIQFLGYQPDSVLQDLIAKAKAFVFAAEEDFGITVVEAQACGTPVICFGKGGVLDSVIPGKTGLFFDEQSVRSIMDSVAEFESSGHMFDPAVIRAHAQTFSARRFRAEFKAFVSERIGHREERTVLHNEQRIPAVAGR
jgi:glycosyltransferase involved in cell wall biosynthesis